MALTAEQREADTNDDGLVSKKEARKFNKKNPDRPLADEYTAEQAAAEYGYRVAVINSDPKLQEIFATAVAEEWTTERFTIAVENWAREAGFGTGSALDAYKKEKEGGTVWEREMEAAVGQIRQVALDKGIDIGIIDINTGAGRQLVTDWIYGGYATRSADAQVTFLAPGGVEGSSGAVYDARESLMALAMNNGVNMSDSWYSQVSDSLARGLSDINIWEADIRKQAAERFPLYAEKIMAGLNVREIASPYIDSMRRILERTDVDLNDPYLTRALGDRDEKGNPRAMTMYDFETLLRQSPEWALTTNGKNTLLNTGTDFMKNLGFVADNPGMVV